MAKRESLDLQTNLPLECELKYLDHFEGEHGPRTKACIVVKDSEHYQSGTFNLWMAGWAMDALVEQGAARETGTDDQGRRQFKVTAHPKLYILRREEKVNGETVKRTNITLLAGGNPPSAPPAEAPPQEAASPRPSSAPDGNLPHPARAASDRRRAIFKSWLTVIDAYGMAYNAAKYIDPVGNHHAMASTILIQADKQGLVAISDEVPGLAPAMIEYLAKRQATPSPKEERQPEPAPEPAPTDQEPEDDLPF